MSNYKNDPESVNSRHLAGFRKLQSEILRILKTEVAPKDYKPVAAAYREAVDGERWVLGLNAAATPDTGEMSLRWLIDKSAGPGGAQLDEEPV